MELPQFSRRCFDWKAKHGQFRPAGGRNGGSLLALGPNPSLAEEMPANSLVKKENQDSPVFPLGSGYNMRKLHKQRRREYQSQMTSEDPFSGFSCSDLVQYICSEVSASRTSSDKLLPSLEVTSRLIQKKFWELASEKPLSDDILLLLQPKLSWLLVHKHWNFVIQHVIALASPRQLETICQLLRGRVVDLSSDSIGCRILCRICEEAHSSEAALVLLLELAEPMHAFLHNANLCFVLQKILEHFPDFPGMDDLLLRCTSEEQRQTSFAVDLLAVACDHGRLKAQHFQEIMAWRHFRSLQEGGRKERIIYEGAHAYSLALESEEVSEQGQEASRSFSCIEEASSGTLSHESISYYVVHPVYYPFFDGYGNLIGMVQGPLLALGVRQMRTSEHPSARESPKAPEAASFSLTWELCRKAARSFFHKEGLKPLGRQKNATIVHLGFQSHGSLRFGLGLHVLEKTSELFVASLCLKLHAGSLTRGVALSFTTSAFDGEPSETSSPILHDFSSSEVYVLTEASFFLHEVEEKKVSIVASFG